MSLNTIFYVSSGLALFSSLLVISLRNPVKSAIAKVFSFLFISIVWLTLQQEYLALLLIFIYLGAVIIIFLFVIMMLEINTSTKQKRLVFYWPFAILFCSFLSGIIIVITTYTFDGRMMLDYVYSARVIGQEMFTNKYLYVFELSGIILLSSMISAIVLTATHSRKMSSKSTNPALQIQVKAKDRLSIIKMKPEK